MRANELTLADGARILRVGRRYMSHLLNDTNEGALTSPAIPQSELTVADRKRILRRSQHYVSQLLGDTNEDVPNSPAAPPCAELDGADTQPV